MKILFSIIIPTLNAEKTIGNLVNKLLKAGHEHKIEVIIIDSQSVDNTIKILNGFQNKFENFKIIKIEKKNFSHSETRNSGVRIANGKYICFFSQDAVPLNRDFLEFFKEDLKDPRAVAVFGKQLPVDGMPFLQKLEMKIRFDELDSFADKTGKIIFDEKKSVIELKKNKILWYSLYNTFACYKRKYLIKNPFPSNAYFGDMLSGKKILEEGMIKIYDNRCRVNHYHILSLQQYIKSQEADYILRIKTFKLNEKPNYYRKYKTICRTEKNILARTYSLGVLSFYYLLKIVIYVTVKFNFYRISSTHF